MPCRSNADGPTEMGAEMGAQMGTEVGAQSGAEMLRSAALPSGSCGSSSTAAVALLESVELPQQQADVLLSSGRRVTLEAGADGDRIRVRDPNGRLVLRVHVSEAGAALELEGDLQLNAPGRLTLAAEDIALHAARDLELCAGRDIRERVAGSRHAQIDGADRLEAASIELQASEQAVGVRAMEGIRLDGEHIGLNDDPAPAPFSWSAIAEEQAVPRRGGTDR